jgi:hypothetical protein
MAIAPAPKQTTASLRFSHPPGDGSRAFNNINADPDTGVRKSNVGHTDYPVTIENARETGAKIDVHGFELFRGASKHTAFTDDDEIAKEYYPEAEQYIKQFTGASRVVTFDHTIRRRRPGVVDDSPSKRQPVPLVHVDQTTESSVARVHRHLPESDAPELLKKRFQIINLWRPINHPALDWPLALCDYRSVDVKKDTFPVALVYPDREGETMGIRYSPDYKFKYFHGMTPEEFVLIKCFDSVQDGSVSIFTPHTAFEDPNTPAGTPPRESIELRALVFYD